MPTRKPSRLPWIAVVVLTVLIGGTLVLLSLADQEVGGGYFSDASPPQAAP